MDSDERKKLNDAAYKLLAQAVLYEAAKAVARLRDGRPGPHGLHEPRDRHKALGEELSFLRYGVQHKGVIPGFKDPLCFHELAGVGDLLEELNEWEVMERICIRSRIFREDKGERTNKEPYNYRARILPRKKGKQ